MRKIKCLVVHVALQGDEPKKLFLHKNLGNCVLGNVKAFVWYGTNIILFLESVKLYISKCNHKLSRRTLLRSTTLLPLPAHEQGSTPALHWHAHSIRNGTLQAHCSCDFIRHANGTQVLCQCYAHMYMRCHQSTFGRHCALAEGCWPLSTTVVQIIFFFKI